MKKWKFAIRNGESLLTRPTFKEVSVNSSLPEMEIWMKCFDRPWRSWKLSRSSLRTKDPSSSSRLLFYSSMKATRLFQLISESSWSARPALSFSFNLLSSRLLPRLLLRWRARRRISIRHPESRDIPAIHDRVVLPAPFLITVSTLLCSSSPASRFYQNYSIESFPFWIEWWTLKRLTANWMNFKFRSKIFWILNKENIFGLQRVLVQCVHKEKGCQFVGITLMSCISGAERCMKSMV